MKQNANTRTLTRQLKQEALRLGADVVGISSIERFISPQPYDLEKVQGYLPTGYGPTELLQDTQSIIVIGIRQLMGVMESTVADIETTYAFGNFGYVHLNRMVNSITYTIARWLEDRSWTALPLGPANASRLDVKRENDGGLAVKLYGIFSVKRAAVLAGAGRRAKNGLLATPIHGTKVRLGAILTTAPLESDPIQEGSPCPAGCNICVETCPMRAITAAGRVEHARCFSDCGRRGATLEEIINRMEQQYPSDKSGVNYVSSEHASIDGFGNRLCRVACMALCPLGENRNTNILRHIKEWGKKHPVVDISF